MIKSCVFHLGLRKEDLQGAILAIIPGDPGRVKKIAEMMDENKYLISNREFNSYLGRLDKKMVVLCSTGIGGPSTSIVVEELAQLGIKTFIRVGTIGAIQPNIMIGDLLISTASVRLDGASLHFAPIEFPAVSDFNCTMALVEATRIHNAIAHIGITVSSDTFYPGQERYETYSGRILSRFRGSMKIWQEMGILGYEMESATLFSMCASQNLRACMVSGVIVNRIRTEIPKVFDVENSERNAIRVAIEAARRL